MKLFSGGTVEKPQEEKGSLLNVGSVLADKATPNRSLCPKMSLKTRIKGWFICLCLGFLISLISAGILKSLLRGDILKFAILYVAGTFCSLGASLFLWGPAAQCKAMFDPKRRWTTIIFLSAVAGTIVSCVFYPTVPVQVILLCVIIQSCSYFWYCLSFIPYGRTLFCKCVKKAADS